MGWTQMIFVFLRSLLGSQAELAAENLALRQQLATLEHKSKRPLLKNRDRIFWVWLSRIWSDWHSVLVIVQPDTVVHFNVTAQPTAEWTAQQVVEAFPDNEAPRFLIRDRDSIYGEFFRRRVTNMGVEEVVIAPRSPWQNPYVERLNDSIRRECLNHLIVLNEQHLKRILSSYFAYYDESRAHLSLNSNAPVLRQVEHPSEGKVIAIPQVGGLHHRYRRAA